MDNYRGWQIEPAYVGYAAFHPTWDEPGHPGAVHAMTLEAVKLEVDYWIEENEDVDS